MSQSSWAFMSSVQIDCCLPEHCAVVNDQAKDVHVGNKSCVMISLGIRTVCAFAIRLYNIDPLKPHFYIVILGFTGVYIIFLISAQKHKLWVLVRTASPRSNEYPQSMF